MEHPTLSLGLRRVVRSVARHPNLPDQVWHEERVVARAESVDAATAIRYASIDGIEVEAGGHLWAAIAVTGDTLLLSRVVDHIEGVTDGLWAPGSYFAPCRN